MKFSNDSSLKARSQKSFMFQLFETFVQIWFDDRENIVRKTLTSFHCDRNFCHHRKSTRMMSLSLHVLLTLRVWFRITYKEMRKKRSKITIFAQKNRKFTRESIWRYVKIFAMKVTLTTFIVFVNLIEKSRIFIISLSNSMFRNSNFVSNFFFFAFVSKSRTSQIFRQMILNDLKSMWDFMIIRKSSK